MRASRLLQLLLLLQNRGRMTAAQLSAELEVTRRTVLRDVDALAEAGLPVVVHRGPHGGIELGFNYRSRLTGLSRPEAEALGVILGSQSPLVDALGLGRAGRAARTKLLESLPDGVREAALLAQARFRTEPATQAPVDPRIAPLAQAIRDGRQVKIRSRSRAPRAVHPVALISSADGWALVDGLQPDRPIPIEEWEDLNISALRFAPASPPPTSSPDDWRR
ncbi:MAG: HTH domain-containing protein [Deltaproteobacteria bacterium]|nr:HTH domain-containing protein [Deltaproteobacteria bacterium]